jgi:CRISPR-associated protein Csm3
MKILKVKKITGQIVVETGLHIGGSVESMEIGGIDNPIIRNSANEQPYIPGSSLKGKMRSLMEWDTGQLYIGTGKGQIHNCKSSEQALKCPICRVFGVSASKDLLIGPTRLIVRDCDLSNESLDFFRTGQQITEIKSENSINRITAEANPRPLERVVPGVSFDMDIQFKVIDLDDGGKTDEENFENVVLRALALVQQDCLGGAGSRGCGKVRFEGLRDENGNPIELPKL